MVRKSALVSALLLLMACTPRKDPGSERIAAESKPPPAGSNASTMPSPQASAAGAPPAEQTAPDATAAGSAKAPLNGLQALKAAKAAGFKVDMIVANPIACPAVLKPTGDPAMLTAKGKLAGLKVDIDGFMREDMGVPEAVALLGAPVLCSGGSFGGYSNLYLAPRDANVRLVTLETHDGDLIGMIVEYEKPVPVDVADLEGRYGKSRRSPGPHDSFEAGSDVFSTQNGSYKAQLMFSHRDFNDPPTARQVHQVIFRRTAMIEILPEGFRSTSDVARLAALALTAHPSDAVRFAGTLGLYQKPEKGRITFGAPLPTRNVESASVAVRSVPVPSADDRQLVQTLDVVFKDLIAFDVDGFARELGKLLKLPTPTAAAEGKRTRVEVVDGGKRRGSVVIEVAPGGIRSLHVERAD